MFRQRPLVRAIALLFSAAYAVATGAGEVTVDSSLETRTSVNDNYQLSSLPQPTVLVLKLTPSLSISETTETSKLHIDIAGSDIQVVREPGESHSTLNLGLGYEIDDLKDTYSVNSGYVHDLTIESELASTGVLLARQPRDDLTLTPSWTHHFSERLQSQISIQADDTRYGGQYETTGLANYHYYALPLAAVYRASEQDSLSLTLTPTLYRAEQINTSVQTNQIDVSWQHSLTENLQWNADVGGFRSRTTLERGLLICPSEETFLCYFGLIRPIIVPFKEVSVLSGSLIHAGLEYQLSEADHFGVHVSRSIAPSGVGTLVLIESLDAGVSRSLTPEAQINIGSSETRTAYLGTASGYVSNFRTIYADVGVKVGPNSKLETGVRTVTSTSAQFGTSIRDNEIYATYQYTWPAKSLSH